MSHSYGHVSFLWTCLIPVDMSHSYGHLSFSYTCLRPIDMSYDHRHMLGPWTCLAPVYTSLVNRYVFGPWKCLRPVDMMCNIAVVLHGRCCLSPGHRSVSARATLSFCGWTRPSLAWKVMSSRTLFTRLTLWHCCGECQLSHLGLAVYVSWNSPTGV